MSICPSVCDFFHKDIQNFNPLPQSFSFISRLLIYDFAHSAVELDSPIIQGYSDVAMDIKVIFLSVFYFGYCN